MKVMLGPTLGHYRVAYGIQGEERNLFTPYTSNHGWTYEDGATAPGWLILELPEGAEIEIPDEVWETPCNIVAGTIPAAYKAVEAGARGRDAAEARLCEELCKPVETVLAGFFGQRSSAEAVRAAVLAVLPEGCALRFVTGGDDSEPEGAIIVFPAGQKMVIDDPRIVGAIDWTGAETRPYQRLRDCPAVSTL